LLKLLYSFKLNFFFFIQGYKCCATGKGKSFAKTELEKLDLPSLTCRQAVKEIVRILYQCHEDAKDSKDFEVEVSWIGPESGNQHQLVPMEIMKEAIENAKQVLLASMDYD
jgi:20S proteasome subunit alpha 7